MNGNITINSPINIALGKEELKIITIRKCLTESCDECTGAYEGTNGLLLKVLCNCECHKQRDKEQSNFVVRVI